MKYTIEEENLEEASLYVNGREYSINKTTGNITLTLGEGEHSLLLLATDRAGNVGKDEATFTVDTEEKVVDISYDDTFIDSSLLLNTSNAELAFNVTCAGNYTVNAYLDNKSIPIRNGTISLEGIEDGVHVLRVVVSVNKEVISESKRTIVIDTHAPRFEKVELLSDAVFVGDNLSLVWKVNDLSGVAEYRVFVNGELYSITQEPSSSIVISEENNTIKIIATDFNGFTSSKTIFVKAKEDRKKADPPKKPDTESPYKDGRREAPPYLHKKEAAYRVPFFNLTFSTLSLTLIAAAIVCYFLKKRKYMALFMGVFFAFSFTVPQIDVGRRVEKGNGNGKQGKLANELKRKGHIQLYESDEPAFRMSNLYGAISDFTLPAEDFPNDTKLLNEKYVSLKYHVKALFKKPWDKEKRTGGKDALITFIPGYNVTDKEAGRKLLDSISTFTETVADYHLGLYGRFATASNLLYAIKLLNDHGLHISILILTHGGKDVGMYTRDAGGLIVNAKHLEYIEERNDYFERDLKVSKVIGLYCHAKDNMKSDKSVLKYFKGKGAMVLGIKGSPGSMDFFQQVQNILTGGVWYIKNVEVKYPVMVGDVKAKWIMKEETSIVNAKASYENKSVSYFAVKKSVSSYIVYENGTMMETNYGTSTEGDMYEKYTDDGGKVTERWKTERVNGYPIRHEFRDKVRSEYIGSVIQKGDEEAEFARMLGDFLTEKPSILEEIKKLKCRGLDSLKEVREAISEIEDYQQLIFDIVHAARDAYAMRFGNPSRKAILYEYRRHLSEIMQMQVKVRTALMSKRWLRMAVNLLDRMDELRELKDDILSAYKRVKEGNYSMETVSRLPTDLKLVRKGIQLSFSFLIIKMKIQITGSFAGSIASILKRKYSDLRDFNKLRGAFITLMRGNFLAKLIPKIDLIQKLLSPLSDKWGEVTSTVERIRSGNYTLSNETLEEIQEDEDLLLWALDRLKTLRVMSFQLLLFRSFYPELAGKIYDKTHQYTSKFFDLLTAKMSLRGLKQIAEIGEHALEVKGKADERIEAIEAIKEEIKTNHDNVTSLLTLKEKLKGNLTILRRRLWNLEELSRKAGWYKYRTYGRILSGQVRGLYNESRWDTVNEYEKDVAGVKLLITLDFKTQEFNGLNATATEVIENLTELVENNETNISKVMKRAGTCLRIVRKLKSINLEVAGLIDVQTGFEDIIEEKARNLTSKMTDNVDAIIDAYKRLGLVVRSNFLIARFEQVNGTIEGLKPEILAELNKNLQEMNTSLIRSLAGEFLDARDELVEIVNKMYEVKREAEAEGFDDIKEEVSGYIAEVNVVLDSVETDATNLRIFSEFIEQAREADKIWQETKEIPLGKDEEDTSSIKGRLGKVIAGIQEKGKISGEDIKFISEKANEYLAITTHMILLNIKLKDNYEAINSSTTLGSVMKEKAEEKKEEILSRDVSGNRDLMVLITYIVNSAGKLLLLHIKEEKEIDNTVSSFKALDEDETRENLKSLKETLRRMKPLYHKCHGSLNFLEAKEGIEEDLKGKLGAVVNLAIDTKERYLLGKLILAQNLPATIRKNLKGKRTRDEACEKAITYISKFTLNKVEDMSSIGLKETDEIPTELLMSESGVKKKIARLKKTALTLSGRASILSRVTSYLSATADSMSQLAQEYFEMVEIKEFIGEKKGELTVLKGEYEAAIEKGDEKKSKLEDTLERIKDYEKQREDAKDEQEEGIEETKEKMDNFVLVDGMLTRIKRGYHDAKARVYQKVDDIFDEVWSKWMRKPVKTALSGLFLGAEFIIDYIVDSEWFRSFISMAWTLLRAGKSLVEIIGYGVAYCFMKLLGGIFWLIEKIMDVTEFITGALGLSNTWFERLMDGWVSGAIGWTEETLMYLKGKLDESIDAFKSTIVDFLKGAASNLSPFFTKAGSFLHTFYRVVVGRLTHFLFKPAYNMLWTIIARDVERRAESSSGSDAGGTSGDDSGNGSDGIQIHVADNTGGGSEGGGVPDDPSESGRYIGADGDKLAMEDFLCIMNTHGGHGLEKYYAILVELKTKELELEGKLDEKLEKLVDKFDRMTTEDLGESKDVVENLKYGKMVSFLPDSEKAWTMEKDKSGAWKNNADLDSLKIKAAHYVINDLLRPNEIKWNVKDDKVEIDHPYTDFEARTDIKDVVKLFQDNVKKIEALQTRVTDYGKVKLGELDERVNGKIDELGLRGDISRLEITRLGIILDPRGLFGEYFPNSLPGTSYLPIKEVGQAMNELHDILYLRPKSFKEKIENSGQFVRRGMLQSGYDIIHAYRLAMAEGRNPKDIKFTFEEKGGEEIEASLSNLVRVVPILANTKYGGGTGGRIGGILSTKFEEGKIWGKGSAEEYLKNGGRGKFKGYPKLEGFNEKSVDLALAYFTDTYKPKELKEVYKKLTSDGTKRQIDEIMKGDGTEIEKVDRIMEDVEAIRSASENIEPVTEKLGDKIGLDTRGGIGSTMEASARSTMISMSMSQHEKTQKVVSGQTSPLNVHTVAELMMHKNAMKNMIEAIRKGKVDEGVEKKIKEVDEKGYIEELEGRVEKVNNALEDVANWKAIAAKSELQLRQVASGVKGGVKSAWKYILLMQFLGMLGLTFGEALYYEKPGVFEGFSDAGKWVRMGLTVVGSVTMVFMMNAEDQRLNQVFGKKGAKIDNANMLIGGFLSGFFGFFTGITSIKIYQGEIEDAFGDALIDHGKEELGKAIKKIFGIKIPLIGKSIGQTILEFLLAGGITMVVQTVVNLMISYIINMVTNYITPWLFQLFGNLGKFDIIEAFGFKG